MSVLAASSADAAPVFGARLAVVVGASATSAALMKHRSKDEQKQRNEPNQIVFHGLHLDVEPGLTLNYIDGAPANSGDGSCSPLFRAHRRSLEAPFLCPCSMAGTVGAPSGAPISDRSCKPRGSRHPLCLAANGGGSLNSSEGSAMPFRTAIEGARPRASLNPLCDSPEDTLDRVCYVLSFVQDALALQAEAGDTSSRDVGYGAFFVLETCIAALEAQEACDDKD